MSGAIAERNGRTVAIPTGHEMSSEQIDLIKRTVCRGATDDELALFIMQCKRTGLDPFSRQVHAVKRYDSTLRREVMTIQTGIDGYRLIAERTGVYAGNDDPVYDREDANHPGKATVTVWKLVSGQRVPFTRSARWAEFVQTKRDGEVTRFWAKMPYLMLGKVAEALALRAAFPQELAGVYTHEEMMQADREETTAVRAVEAREEPTAAIDDDPKPAPTMVRVEVGANIKALAKLKDVESAMVEGMLFGMVQKKYGTARKSVADLTTDELTYVADSVHKSLVRARAEAEAGTAVAPTPKPETHPVIEREPGIDPEDEPEPTGPAPAVKMPKPIVDQTLEVMRECGVQWADIITHSAKSGKHNFLRRTLARDSKVADLTLEDHDRVREWCRKEKAARTKPAEAVA